jgi:hypothetical protein
MDLKNNLNTLIDSIELGRFSGRRPGRATSRNLENDPYIKSLRHYKSIRLQTHTMQCDICGYVPPREFSTILHVHHFIPFSSGGGNSLNNLMLVCPTCHAICHKIIRVSENLLPNTRKSFIWFVRQVIKDYEGLRVTFMRIFNDDDEDLLVERNDKIYVDVEKLFDLVMEYYKLYSDT